MSDRLPSRDVPKRRSRLISFPLGMSPYGVLLLQHVLSHRVLLPGSGCHPGDAAAPYANLFPELSVLLVLAVATQCPALLLVAL